MKISVERNQFLKALSHGQSVVERKTTIPILSHVLLQAEGDTLTLTTTDMDLALVESVPAFVQTPGSLTLSAQMLFDIVRKLPEGIQIELTMNEETGQVNLKGGKTRFNLSYLPATQFPKLTQDELPHSFKLSVETLRYLIDRAKFAMLVDDNRYYLNGIYFHCHEQGDKKVFRSVATDGHRLACIEAPIPEGAENIPGIIVGRKTLLEVRKLLEEQATEVTVSLSANRVEFKLPTATLRSRLIDATYPNYEEGIPTENDRSVIVDAKEFSAAIDRIATVAIDKDKSKFIKFSVCDNTLTLSAASNDIGDGLEELAVDYPSTQQIDIGFNARYLLDVAQQINDDEAQILLYQDEHPAIIKGINDQNSLFVVMPVRI